MYKTEQELFWAGSFGTEYISRNNDDKLISSNIAFFYEIFKHTKDIDSVLEFGANIGMNIIPIKRLLPEAEIAAIEINKDACTELGRIPSLQVYNESILEFIPDKKYDFVFTKGVLIHINPDELDAVYQKLYETSSKYICIAEYYSASPVSLPYRGYENRLFKRDFAGELMDKYPGLSLVSYGFSYRRDNNFPQGDITWFLLKK